MSIVIWSLIGMATLVFSTIAFGLPGLIAASGVIILVSKPIIEDF